MAICVYEQELQIDGHSSLNPCLIHRSPLLFFAATRRCWLRAGRRSAWRTCAVAKLNKRCGKGLTSGGVNFADNGKSFRRIKIKSFLWKIAVVPNPPKWWGDKMAAEIQCRRLENGQTHKQSHKNNGLGLRYCSGTRSWSCHYSPARYRLSAFCRVTEETHVP